MNAPESQRFLDYLLFSEHIHHATAIDQGLWGPHGGFSGLRKYGNTRLVGSQGSTETYPSTTRRIQAPQLSYPRSSRATPRRTPKRPIGQVALACRRPLGRSRNTWRSVLAPPLRGGVGGLRHVGLVHERVAEPADAPQQFGRQRRLRRRRPEHVRPQHLAEDGGPHAELVRAAAVPLEARHVADLAPPRQVQQRPRHAAARGAVARERVLE